MKIEITEETGIRHEREHYKYEEIREVPDHLGLFFVMNGWATDVEGDTEQGVRGDLDFEDPETWAKGKKESAKEQFKNTKTTNKDKTVRPRDTKSRLR